VTDPVNALNGIHYFEFYSEAPKRGLNYYRVQVEDDQSNTAYSNIEEVVLYNDSKIAMLYPNPVEDVLTLELFDTFDEQDVTLEIFSVSGKQMATLEVDAEQRRMQLDFNAYPAGVYLVRLRLGETNIRTMKVVKRK
ncbi:MAG: T9SS type A sorting domain-containing protein, partial [Bacteroidota bacterium]